MMMCHFSPVVWIMVFSILSLPTLVWSQCNNYGIPTSIPGICACPIGFSGSNCTDLSCGNPLETPEGARPLFLVTPSSAGTTGCGTQCTTGFTGPNCNVCTSNGACSVALTLAASSSTSTSPASSSGLTGSKLGGGGSPSSDVICSESAWTWTEGFVSCDVIVSLLLFYGSCLYPANAYFLPSVSRTLHSNQSSPELLRSRFRRIQIPLSLCLKLSVRMGLRKLSCSTLQRLATRLSRSNSFVKPIPAHSPIRRVQQQLTGTVLI